MDTRKTEKNLSILRTLFTVSLIISNVVTGKLFNAGVCLFGVTVKLPGAVLCYAITFLATDVIGEIWGKKEADQTVLYGFIGQIMATLLIVLTRYIPAADEEVQRAYVQLLGQNHVFVIGSMIAYYTSQTWDVYIFHRLREIFVKKKGTNKDRWIWNNISTATSQMIDTVLFISLSFGIGLGWFADEEMREALAAMIVGQYVYKLLLAALDTPVFYLLTRNKSGYDVG